MCQFSTLFPASPRAPWSRAQDCHIPPLCNCHGHNATITAPFHVSYFTVTQLFAARVLTILHGQGWSYGFQRGPLIAGLSIPLNVFLSFF